MTTIIKIRELDEKLATMSDMFKKCDSKDNDKWMRRIDEVLDERLKLMKQRDQE
jgi:hypothetical protein